MWCDSGQLRQKGTDLGVNSIADTCQEVINVDNSEAVKLAQTSV